jgi:hypothetical protein
MPTWQRSQQLGRLPVRYLEDTGGTMPEPYADPQGEGGDIKGQEDSNLAPSVD